MKNKEYTPEEKESIRKSICQLLELIPNLFLDSVLEKLSASEQVDCLILILINVINNVSISIAKTVKGGKDKQKNHHEEMIIYIIESLLETRSIYTFNNSH